jgi:AraC family transcriptional regulator
MRTDTRNSYLENINKAIAYIEGNVSHRIQLKDIASQANISEYHFHRIFKSITGDTTKEFLTRLRLEKAGLKLKHSADDIGQIAFDCGYQNHETFTRSFKDYFGLAPADYRSSMKALTIKKQEEYRKSSVDLNTLSVQGPIIQSVPAMSLAFIRHNGSYDHVGSSFRRLMLWAAKNWVLKLKPVTLGIVHDNPDLTDEHQIRFDACLLVSKDITPSGEVGYKKLEGGKCAVFTYQGAYNGFYPVYDYIYNVCLFEKKFDLADRPAFEWYVKSPPFYKPEHFVTDFYIPIK